MKFLLTIILLIPTLTAAHSGRTDSNGGHYNRSTGEYHFHNSGHSKKSSSPSFFGSILDKYFDDSDEPVKYFSLRAAGCVGNGLRRTICWGDIKDGKYIKDCEKDYLCSRMFPNNLKNKRISSSDTKRPQPPSPPKFRWSNINTDENIGQNKVSHSCEENGSCYGDISRNTNKPKTVRVQGYYRKDGTYVRGHYRSK